VIRRLLLALGLAVAMTACSPRVVLLGTVLPPAAAPDFVLTDQDGRPFDLAAERGKAVMLTFGYTHCPDVCPTTMANLAQVVRRLGPDAAHVAVVFVTVDPRRDTPAVLRRYVGLFDRRFIGLTGTPGTLEPVYRAYHVWHQELPNAGSAAGYLMAHSTSIYLIDPQGRLRVLHDWTDARTAIASDLKALLS
jgi:protein SCO1